jgi:hypothetical protein
MATTVGTASGWSAGRTAPASCVRSGRWRPGSSCGGAAVVGDGRGRVAPEGGHQVDHGPGRPAPISSVFEIVGLNGLFVVLFIGSAWLFRRAARKQPTAGAGLED